MGQIVSHDLTFTSDAAGEVTVTMPGETAQPLYVFSAEEWAEVVATVSAAGPDHKRAALLLHRSSVTGQFITADEAAANPDTTTTERD
jgi:Cys-tRNA synthase (O-phospho-L-seryl-tRNA:Cys-tRNA synthase)